MYNRFRRKTQISRQAACLMGQRIAPPSRKSTVEEPPSAEGKYKHRNNQHPDQEKNRRFKAAVSRSISFVITATIFSRPSSNTAVTGINARQSSGRGAMHLNPLFMCTFTISSDANRQAVVKRSIFCRAESPYP